MDLSLAFLSLGLVAGSGFTLALCRQFQAHELVVTRSHLVDAIVKFEAQNRIIAEQADLIRQLRGDAEHDPQTEPPS